MIKGRDYDARWCDSCHAYHLTEPERLAPTGKITVSWLPRFGKSKAAPGVWIARPECTVVHHYQDAGLSIFGGWRDRGPGYDHEHYEAIDDTPNPPGIDIAELGKSNSITFYPTTDDNPDDADFRRRWLNALTGSTHGFKGAEVTAQFEDEAFLMDTGPKIDKDPPPEVKPYHSKIFLMDEQNRVLVSLDISGAPEIVAKVITWVGDVTSDYIEDHKYTEG